MDSARISNGLMKVIPREFPVGKLLYHFTVLGKKCILLVVNTQLSIYTFKCHATYTPKQNIHRTCMTVLMFHFGTNNILGTSCEDKLALQKVENNARAH